MLANSTLLYPVQSQAKVTKLQIQTLKTSFPSLEPLETFIEQKWLKKKCTNFYFSEILTAMLAMTHPTTQILTVLGF